MKPSILALVLVDKMREAVPLDAVFNAGDALGLSTEETICAHIEACRTYLAAAELAAETQGVSLTHVPTLWNITQRMERKVA